MAIKYGELQCAADRKPQCVSSNCNENSCKESTFQRPPLQYGSEGKTNILGSGFQDGTLQCYQKAIFKLRYFNMEVSAKYPAYWMLDTVQLRWCYGKLDISHNGLEKLVLSNPVPLAFAWLPDWLI